MEDGSNRSLTVRDGAITAQRVFDVAYAIDLGVAEQSWRGATPASSRRGRLSTVPAKAVSFDVPPVVLELQPVTVTLDGRDWQARAGARLYDFGVISLALTVVIAERPWVDFVALVEAVERSVGASSGSAVWNNLLEQVMHHSRSALQRPATERLEEDYLYASVRGFDQSLNATQLGERVDLSVLLSGESRPLSTDARRELLRCRFSYYEDDLVVLTWDRAFIYDPRGENDVADVLEIANAQLLELRYYDELLDRELPRMYDLVEATQRSRFNPIAAGRFAKLARRLYALVAEVTELKEKVDNALQVTEDIYLARIYGAALEQFRVANVGRAVDRKLSIIRDTYIALYDEASSRRAEILEITIVLLIALEIVMAFVH